MQLGMVLHRGTRRGLSGRQRGQAVVEMALVMSILLILTFGMADFGLFLTGYIRASNCAREVTRAAVVRNPDAPNMCDSHQLEPLFESVTVTVDPAGYMDADAGSAVTVTVVTVYRWKAIAPLINAFSPGDPWGETNTTTTTSTMRMEGRRP